MKKKTNLLYIIFESVGKIKKVNLLILVFLFIAGGLFADGVLPSGSGIEGDPWIIENLGIDGVINYRKQDFATEIRRLNSGNGVDVVLEVVGGEVYRKSIGLLNPFGRLVVIGFASLNLQKWNPFSIYRTLKAIPRVNVSKMAERSYAVGASHLGYLLKNPQLMQQIWSDLTDCVQKHNIRPVIGHSFKFEQMATAHKLMESRQSTGKIVVEIDND